MTTTNGTVDAYCASCDEDGVADAQTGRCGKCGKLATTHLPTRSLGEIRRDAGMGYRNSPSAGYRPDPTRTALDNATARQQAGMPASQHDSKPAPAPAVLSPAPPPDLTRFKLPSSAPTRRWFEATRALGVGLTAAAIAAEQKAAALEAKIAEQVAEFKAEAMRLRNSARVITQLLEQVGLEAEAPQAARPHRATRSRPSGSPWAKTRDGGVFTACRTCGRSDVKHKAKGLCSVCYRS